MAGFEFRKATKEEVDKVLQRVRPENVAEMDFVGLDLRSVTLFSVAESSECFVFVIDGDPVCVFGVVPTEDPGEGRPWMVGSQNIDVHVVPFLRASKAVVRDMLTRWRVLRNFADSRNTRGLRWLRFLGFSIHPPVALLDGSGLAMQMFERRR